MARVFVRAANEYVQVGNAVITGYPFTILAWFRSDDATTEQAVLCVADSGVTNNFHSMLIKGSAAGDKVWAFSKNGNTHAETASGYTVGTWHHGAAVFAAANSRTAYIDGGDSGADAGASNDTGFDATAIGRHCDSTPGDYLDGAVAEAVVLKIAATDYHVWLHAQGVPAPVIWPGWAIAAYYTLFETDRDFPTGRYNMAPFNTPGWVPHPPKVLEFWRRYQLRAVTTQTTIARLAPWVWNVWSSKGPSPEPTPPTPPDVAASILWREAWKSQDD